MGLGVLAVSFAAIFFVKAQPTHPLLSAGIRLAIAAALLSPFLFKAASAGKLDRSLLGAGALGGLCYAVHFGAWVASLERTSVAASVTLVASTPILLALLSLVTGRDRPSKRIFAAIGLATVGIAMLGAAELDAGGGGLVGKALALLGCIAMAFYLLLVRSRGPGLDPVVFSAVACSVGSALLLGTASVIGIPLEVASSEALLYLALAALFPQLVGHLSLTWALRYTTPTVVALAVTCEPVLSTLLGIVILAQVPSPLAALGCAVVVAAIVLVILSERHATSASKAQVES